MKKNYLVIAVLFYLLTIPGAVFGQTEAEVGDVASFGREAKFFGYAQTGAVFVRRECVAPYIPSLGADDRCFASPGNAVTFDAKDIGRIHFREKTFDNIIYILARHQYAYALLNSATSNRIAQFEYTPYITLESSALNDPTLINPQTGQPFDGKVDLPLSGGKTFSKTLLPSYQEIDSATYSTTAVSGLTKKFLMTNYALPQAVVDDLFYQKMTIQLNIRGRTFNTERATYGYGLRVLGN